MWKKNQPESPVPPEQAAQPSPAPRTGSSRHASVIGPSMSVKGDIDGDGDLLILGRVKGAIQLPRNTVTIGSPARVEADIHGRRISIEGEVKGDLLGDEVEIREEGRVEGDATAPRVTLDNGCHFRGRINMQPKSEAASSRPRISPRRVPQAVGA